MQSEFVPICRLALIAKPLGLVDLLAVRGYGHQGSGLHNDG